MGHIGKSLQAGLIATIVLSALMLMKSLMGIMPELDLPMMIAGMMGAENQPLLGWAIHFMIGIGIYGIAMALLDKHLPGESHVTHGIIIGVIGWLLMMVMLMPMVGVGLFGMNLGIMAPMMTLILHVIFGAVLGGSYGWLSSPDAGVARMH